MLRVNIVLVNVRPIDETVVLANVRPILERVEKGVAVPLTVLTKLTVLKKFNKLTVLKNEFTTAGDTTGILDIKIIVLSTGVVLVLILDKLIVLCVVEVNEIKFV